MLTAFTAGLLLITVSEIGDKTFFIAAIMAMKHPRRWVLIGAIAALTVMTVLSVLMGQVASLLPLHYVQWAEVALFLGFGLKLLLDARKMSSQVDLCDQQEAIEAVTLAEKKLAKRGKLAIVAQTFGMTFVAEWGDRTQFTTVALAAANNPIGVTLGAILGHSLCAVIAVVCGKLICGRISERTITLLGGSLFLLFGTIGLVEMIQLK